MECDLENEVPVPSLNETGPAKLSSSSVTQDDVNETEKVATQFSKYYYELLEKKPHKVGQLYLEHSVLQWDGNPIVTREGIQKFLEGLPSLTFTMMSLDCQQINAAAVGNRKTLIIKTSGRYRASGEVRAFTQQIIITADGDKWRIAADDFRSQ